MTKAIISVVGKDQVGIISKVCTYLASKDININDISQTIMQGYFNMMMIVSISDKTEFSEVVEGLNELGEEIGVSIKMQHEEFFNQMHRI